MMMKMVRSLVLLSALLGSACGGDDACDDNKAGGSSCSASCECASNYCIPEENVCSAAEKPE